MTGKIIINNFLNNKLLALSFMLGLPFIPYKLNSVYFYQFVNFIIIFVLFTQYPGSTYIKFNTYDSFIIGLNIVLSYLSYYKIIQILGDSLYEINSITDINTIEVFYMILWVISIEIGFFSVHMLLHNSNIYKYIHKMHHKFIITNSFTTFYSHPIDNLFIIWNTFLPMIAMSHLGYVFSVTSMSVFSAIAVNMFISSHSTFQKNHKIIGTNHLLHHTKINTNFGNFGILDMIMSQIS